MDEGTFRYVIVGGGLAGATAIQGIRELDPKGMILLLGEENHLPYHRPPLSKKLWLGKQKTQEIYIYDRKFYEQNLIHLILGTKVTGLDPKLKQITDADGHVYHFEKLLLATGTTPKVLPIPGGQMDGIHYFRTLDDYLAVKPQALSGSTAVVVGGGFIGSEMASALAQNRVEVTWLFPENYPCSRLFPAGLGKFLLRHYEEKGVTVLAGDRPVAFEKNHRKFVVTTALDRRLEADIVIVGAGVSPNTALAEKAGLEIKDGIAVNTYLQTSHPDIFAAGDNAWFPYTSLGVSQRLEHWDHALNHGKAAGRNMAGAHEPYHYQPYFFSDLFEFGYEAVGEIDSRLETEAQWEKENQTGTIYYLKNGVVRGVLLCNVWGQVDRARELIREQRELAAA